MGAAEAGTVNGVTVLAVAFCVLVPLVWVYVARHRGGRRRRRGSVLTVVLPLVGSMGLAYPAALLVLGVPEGRSHPEAWVWTAVSPLVAVLIAWWFGRDFPRPRAARLLTRAGVLYLACLAAVLWAVHAGLPVFSVVGVGNLVALTAILVCVITWQLIDRRRPAQLLVRAGWILAVCAAVAWLARTNDVQVGTGAATSTGTLVAVGLIALVALAGALTCIAAWRLLRRHRRELRRRAGPQPGEVWNAEVPFEDDENVSKDRPVLVLHISGDDAEVMKITSQDKSHLDGYRHLPHARWRGVLAKDSWLSLRATRVPLENFRSFRGRCRPDVWADVGSGYQPQR